jgi:hypothetical protein
MGKVWQHNSIIHPPFTFNMEHAQPKSQAIFYVLPVLGITLIQRYGKEGHRVMDTFLRMSTLIPTQMLCPQGPQKMIQCMKK